MDKKKKVEPTAKAPCSGPTPTTPNPNLTPKEAAEAAARQQAKDVKKPATAPRPQAKNPERPRS